MSHLSKQGVMIPLLPMAPFLYNMVSIAFAGLAPMTFSHPVFPSRHIRDPPEEHEYALNEGIVSNYTCLNMPDTFIGSLILKEIGICARKRLSTDPIVQTYSSKLEP